jgi:hypothetical protein
MRWTGRTDVDLAILSYDERIVANTCPANVRHPWTPCVRADGQGRAARKDGCFPTAGKAIDVRA